MRLVLVTGAGASRNLGKPDPLPLMNEWCDRLCGALEEREAGLAAAIHLSQGLSSEEFEKALGELTRWQEMRWLNERFVGLGGPHANTSYGGEVVTARGNEEARLAQIRQALDESLYSEFGAARVEAEAAGQAYGGLLGSLGATESVVGVTTNYDPSLEMGLERQGITPFTGFPRRFGQTPRLSPDGMVDWEGNHSGRAPVIHLHGAVGWYRQDDGDIVEHHQDQPYNPTLGVPLVLYPDPEKDPTNDAMVDALWREFDKALDGATHVLVLGHSLNDPALIERLRRLNPAKTRLAVCIHDSGYFKKPDSYNRRRNAKRDRVQSLLRSASVIRSDFGMDPKFDPEALDRWAAGKPEPAIIETR